MALTQIKPAGLSKPVDLADNEEIRLGTGNDLKIYHNGTDSYIDNEYGYLYLNNDSSGIRLKSGNSWANGSMAAFYADGAVELYHDNAKKFETTAIGVTITGDLKILDGEQLRLGNSNDLMVHHDGTDSWVANSTGDLYIRNTSDDVFIQAQDDIRLKPQDGQAGVNIIGGGAVELYHNNSKKLETVSGGVTVTGTVTATSFSGDGSNLTGVTSVGGATGVDFNDNVKARFGASNDLQLFHESSSNDNIIDCATTRPLRIRFGGANQFEFFSSGGFKMNDGRKIVLGDSTDFTLFHDGSVGNIIDCRNAKPFFVVNDTGGGNETMIKATPNSSVELFHDGTREFMTVNGGCAIGINAQMNSSKLSIAKDGTHLSLRSFATGGYDSIIFRSANTTVGKIHFNSGGTQYHTTSDYRRKNNITNLTGAIDRVKTLLPKRFNYKTEPSVRRDGFLAHEITAVPEAVLGTKDQVATEKDVTEGKAEAVGDPIYQTIDQSALIPLLTAAVKELIAKVEVLEAA